MHAFLSTARLALLRELDEDEDADEEMLAVYNLMANASPLARTVFDAIAEGVYSPKPTFNTLGLELKFTRHAEHMLMLVEERWYEKDSRLDPADPILPTRRGESCKVRSGYAFLTTEHYLMHVFLKGKHARDRVHYIQPGGLDSDGNPYLIRLGGDRPDKKVGLNGRDPVTHYTLQNYRYRASFITEYDWPKSLGELTAPDVVEFRSWLLRSEISRDLAGKVLFTFQSMMREMTVRGLLPLNCAAGIGIRSDSRYDEQATIPTKAEIKALLKAADELSNAKNQTVAKAWQRYRPMLYLAVDSGMRPQEYLAAARSALVDRGIRVERALEGDGKNISVTKTPTGRRFVELSPDTVAMVRHYAEKLAPPSEFDLLFPDNRGGWQSRRNWQRRGFDVACEHAGLVIERTDENGETEAIPKFRPYDLRHFFASYHIDRGTNLKKIQKMMGHKDIQTTLNVYGHLLDEDEIGETGVIGELWQ